MRNIKWLNVLSAEHKKTSEKYFNKNYFVNL